jgi:hypothetical protein
MAWAIDCSPLRVSELESVAFQVWAPRVQLEREPSFRMYLERESLVSKVVSRVEEYKCDPERYDELRRWLNRTFLPLLDRMHIAAVPWEDVVSGLSGQDRESLTHFYERCLTHNRRGPGEPSRASEHQPD